MSVGQEVLPGIERIQWDLLAALTPVHSEPPAGAADRAVHTSRHIKTHNSLRNFCGRAGLLLGQYAITGRVGLVPYFQKFGLSMEALENLQHCYPEHFGEWFGVAKAAEALAKLEAAFGWQRVWVPRYLHVYQRVHEFYTNFGWHIQPEARSVVFVNYPQDDDGHRPTLYDLATRLTVLDPNFVTPPRPPREHSRRKRIRVSLCGHVEEIRLRYRSRNP